MAFYVYIIKSQKDNSFYKGFSENSHQRLIQHNKGESHYTSSKTPWILVCLLKFDSKVEAIIKERKLKKYSNASLITLINSTQNTLLR